MKVIVCKDEDADALLAKMRLKHVELASRFAQQDQQQKYVVDETSRGMMFVLIDWLQAQGFVVR